MRYFENFRLNVICWKLDVTVITPFFTPEILSGVGMQNKATQTDPAWSNKGSPHQNNLKTGSGAHFPGFDQDWPSLTKVWPSRSDPTRTHHIKRTSRQSPGAHFPEFGEVWPRFDRGIDRTKNWIGLTVPWPLDKAYWELRFDTLRVENGRETRELWAKPWKSVQHLTKFYQVLLTKQPIWEATFTREFFPTCGDLVRKLKPLSKKVT